MPKDEARLTKSELEIVEQYIKHLKPKELTNTELKKNYFLNREVESKSEREKLPEFKIIKGLVSRPNDYLNTLQAKPLDLKQFDKWTRSHGGLGSSKFSNHNLINIQNVKNLKLAWTYNASKDKNDKWRAVQTNPIFAEGSLYLTTPKNSLVSLNPVSGKLNWEYFPRDRTTPVARRGITYWKGKLIFTEGFEVVCLHANSGQPVKDFAKEGRAHIGRSLGAPVITEYSTIIATLVDTPSAVISIDSKTGKKKWLTNLNDGYNSAEGASPWSGFSYDKERDLIFVQTGNPRPAFIGVNRHGPNNYSNSVVALSGKDGSIVWSHQEISHGLWDLDIPSPPALTQINVKNKKIDVVAIATKIGNLLLLERSSGTPVFDYHLRKVPSSVVPGEKTSAYQPELLSPEPFSSSIFNQNDITDITKKDHDFVKWKTRNSNFGFLIPPEVGRTFVYHGINGGAEYAGVAINHINQTLYVTSNQIPFMAHLFFRLNKQIPADVDKIDLYQKKCSSCHGIDREGVYLKLPEAIEKPIKFIPSLIGLTLTRNKDRLLNFESLKTAHKYIQEFSITEEERIKLVNSFSTLDNYLKENQLLDLGFSWHQLLDTTDLPASKPPWGKITAYNLNTGKIIWSKPFGEYEHLRKEGVPKTGQPNYGGLITTAGDLVFASGTIDGKFTAFNAKNGKELWSYQLPASSAAPPITYKVNNEQYVTIIASGGKYHNFNDRSFKILTFKLKK